MRCGVAIEELNQHKSPLGTRERKHGSDREKLHILQSGTGQTARSRWFQRLLIQIITKRSQNLQRGSWDRDEPLHKKNQPKTQRITRISWGKEAKEGFPKTPKTSIRGTRDSREFSSRLDGREANHGVTKPTKRKLRTQKSPKERKSIYDQRMNENTRDLLKKDSRFHSNSSWFIEDFNYTRARPPLIHLPSQICGPSYNLDHFHHGDLSLTLEQRECRVELVD